MFCVWWGMVCSSLLIHSTVSSCCWRRAWWSLKPPLRVLMSFLSKDSLIFIWKVELQREGDIRRDRQIFHPLVYSSNGHHGRAEPIWSQDHFLSLPHRFRGPGIWARPQQEAGLEWSSQDYYVLICDADATGGSLTCCATALATYSYLKDHLPQCLMTSWWAHLLKSPLGIGDQQTISGGEAQFSVENMEYIFLCLFLISCVSVSLLFTNILLVLHFSWPTIRYSSGICWINDQWMHAWVGS